MNGSAQEFANFHAFFRFYVQQHSHPGNRWLHAIGTVSGIAVVVAAFAMHHSWAALLWPVIAYGCAWTGHFFIEGNRPATFGHPLWSFLGDFRMLGLMLTGRLDSYLDRSA
jgi:hypothetical protein